MNYDDIVNAVRDAMDHEPTAEEQLEQRADFILRELDEFCALATRPETVELIESQKIIVGQIQTRAQLILSFLAARQPAKLRMISNG